MIRRHGSILWAIILVLCNIQLSLSSSSSTSSTSSIVSAKSQQTEKPNKRTIVSGFGAHNTKHSIFGSASSGSSTTESNKKSPSPTKKASKKQQSQSSTSKSLKESIIGADFDFSSNSLLVYKQDKDDSSDGDNDDNVNHQTDSIVWLMDPKTNQKMCIWVNEEGDWMAELVEDDKNSAQPGQIPQPPPPAPTTSSEMNGWAPVEGIYGFYKVPTGILLVLIAKTRNVFDAPPLQGSSSTREDEEDWWKIDKVQQLEVVHLSNSKAQQELSPTQIKEEIRQLRLLRKAWKQHDFYCCQYSDGSMDDDSNIEERDHQDSRGATSSKPIVRDMTKSLQSSFLAHHQQQQESKRSRKSETESQWWTANPDPRFFWNQVAVEPILAKCSSTSEQAIDLEEDPSLMDPCTYFLLDHTIPVTSAFVGIQSDISCGNTNEDDDNDDEEEQSKSPRYTYTQLLISRRSRFRAGTRFTRRGADANGAVANYVETEQVLLLSQKNATNDTIDKIASHVQTRGSIPIRWSSPADVKTYRPKVHIGTDPLAQARALRWHLLEQQAHYVLLEEGKKTKKKKTLKDENESEMVFVNLVDKKSDQGRLGKAFDEVLQAVLEVHSNNSTTDTTIKGPLVKHVWYDFHAEVKNGRWDRLSILLKDLEPYLMAHNYFVVSTTTTNSFNSNSKNNKSSNNNNNGYYQIESKQTSMVRTNCMDCLDRTNVVQSILGRYVLFEQLVNNPYLNNNANSSSKTKKKLAKRLNKQFQKAKHLSLPWPQSEKSHRALWADNADEISRLYAGTPALKRDFTRTGQRTKLGALDDGMNSLQRYYLNNFMDADRQEGMDLMVGYASFSNVNGGGGAAAASSSSRNDENDNGDNNNGKGEEDGNIFATRRSFLGGLFQPQSSLLSSDNDDQGGSDNDDASSDAEEEDDDGLLQEDEKDALDLRWVPGDLQEHLRSRAEETTSESYTTFTTGTTSTTTKEGLLPKLKFGFSPTRALKAMDERSTSDLPWWSLQDTNADGNDDDAESSSSTTAATIATTKDGDSNSNWLLEKLAPHQRHPTPTRGGVLGVLLLGFRAPMVVAVSMVVLLGLLYLQEILMHDWNMAGSMALKFNNSSRSDDDDGELLEEEDDEEEYEFSDDDEE
eukprot:CAMPEP_0113633238 /NCGR_PEP_ID=MMETSP0017_2-20120614/17297_1 /TAXON_ID=2856 /ORGANISM="Cylindrotheca closterium" /LENGTH=1131 /DNA_ID=CAMNT_0000543867 /DNA_START=40 /DNA_END=3432 /DNA_ORIENTATION=+ /assembly_acc=CAM_ASM_000147